MVHLSPYSYAVSSKLAANVALQTFSHQQMTATANALYNLYAFVDTLKKGAGTQQERFDLEQELIAHCDAYEGTIEGVHQAFVNCSLALEIAYKTAGEEK